MSSTETPCGSPRLKKASVAQAASQTAGVISAASKRPVVLGWALLATADLPIYQVLRRAIQEHDCSWRHGRSKVREWIARTKTDVSDEWRFSGIVVYGGGFLKLSRIRAAPVATQGSDDDLRSPNSKGVLYIEKGVV